MIDDQYLDMVESSLVDIKSILPENTRLLFTTLVDNDILMEGLLEAEAENPQLDRNEAPLNGLRGI
ncbi:MAG: hypothetical protein R3251_04520, partial [Candidatus Spechtbacterales bacterium]|nr:hypothetical protein [Candidatus Spechtbacterales bacterium]